jgi:hypothetical protein
MRPRFKPDGSLDPEAERELEILRQAEEALRRQREIEEAARTMGDRMLGAPTVTEGIPAATPLAKQGKDTRPPLQVGGPKMPHEEGVAASAHPLHPALPANQDLKPPALPGTGSELSWPPRTTPGGNSQASGHRRRRS